MVGSTHIISQYHRHALPDKGSYSVRHFQGCTYVPLHYPRHCIRDALNSEHGLFYSVINTFRRRRRWNRETQHVVYSHCFVLYEVDPLSEPWIEGMCVDFDPMSIGGLYGITYANESCGIQIALSVRI